MATRETQKTAFLGISRTPGKVFHDILVNKTKKNEVLKKV